MRPKTNVQTPVDVRPVHPTNIRHHGLFGEVYVRQHMMADDRWTVGSLTEQFKGMTNLLSKRAVFKKLEASANRKEYVRESHKLKHQIRDGRSKLQMILHGENTKHIRNYLINHKDMQRLYQKMPVHLVVDNINQRTFVMRKERDRLRFRLNKLKAEYETKLLERSVIENRIKYENEFVLEEEVKSCEFRKKIENSDVRLRAIKTINATYKKMLQVLRHDGIFYEPILRSLSKDTEDQGNFIKHILFLGMPAIAKFKDLNEEYRVMEEKSRKHLQHKLHMLAAYKNVENPTANVKIARPEDLVSISKRYVRETSTMLFLKNELEAVENTIKMVKCATLCSQAKEIFPRIKSQVENNQKLQKMIKNNILGYRSLKTKQVRADVLEGVLINNLTEGEIKRLEYIKELQAQIEDENEIEQKLLAHIKNRADAYVLLRYTLWNLNEILRHIDKSVHARHMIYPNSELKLPLLKFEMLTMRSLAPDCYEENIDNIMNMVKKKVLKLMKAYTGYKDITKEDMALHKTEYHAQFLQRMDVDDMAEQGEEIQEVEDEIIESKTLQNVPNRKTIKAQSAKLVEELSKKEE